MFSQSSDGTVARRFTVMHCLFFTRPPLIITPKRTCAFDHDVYQKTALGYQIQH